MMLWLTIVVAGLLTYAQRLSLIALWEKLQLPPVLERALRFVPVAVLVALIVPDLLQPPPAGAAVPLNPRLPAGLLAAAVAWYTRNVTLTIGAGMLALLVLSLLF